MSSELKVGYRTVDGLQIRYADSDGPASEQLMLSPAMAMEPSAVPSFGSSSGAAIPFICR